MQGNRKIVVLGATGSIGVNSLNVVERLPQDFQVIGLTTHTNVKLLMEQSASHRPMFVAVTGRNLKDTEKSVFDDLGITVFSGENSLMQIVEKADYDMLVNAVVGAAGFLPTLKALELNKDIALANKETLVVGGELVIQAAAKNECAILPIDSEHSAIFQCLVGEKKESIEEILLTASGGPFRTLSKEQFARVTVAQALHHPNWNMGKKITIDSATMMNKGLEVIEARWLFGVPLEKVHVLIHPQSIIHSMVAFHDGSIKAQLGVPDMRVPIQYALTFPNRRPSQFPRLDFSKMKSLTFEEPDLIKFRALAFAFEASKTGGTAPAVMNAANEIAVRLFLNEKIRFDQIADTIEKTLNAHDVIFEPATEDLIFADKWARDFVLKRCCD